MSSNMKNLLKLNKNWAIMFNFLLNLVYKKYYSKLIIIIINKINLG